MDDVVITVLAIAFAALFSRLAGAGIGGSAVWALLSGVAASIAVFGLSFGWPPALFAIGWSMARKIGLGNAIGPALLGRKRPDVSAAEWWQTSHLLDSTWLSVLVLGVLRGVLLVPAVLFAGRPYFWVPVALAFGTLAAVAIGRLLVVYAGRNPDDGWAGQELLYPIFALAPVLAA